METQTGTKYGVGLPRGQIRPALLVPATENRHEQLAMSHPAGHASDIIRPGLLQVTCKDSGLCSNLAPTGNIGASGHVLTLLPGGQRGAAAFRGNAATGRGTRRES